MKTVRFSGEGRGEGWVHDIELSQGLLQRGVDTKTNYENLLYIYRIYWKIGQVTLEAKNGKF